MDLITLDFETFYDKEFSLTKLTTESYIRDERFEMIGFAVKVNDGETVWHTGSKEHLARVLASYDWGNSMLLCQNTAFDAGILSFVFDIHPKKLLDTMCIARAQLGVDVSVSLANLAKHYEVGEKGTEVIQALGKRRADFAPDELQRYAEYCVNDVELTYGVFNAQMRLGFPTGELSLIDITLRAFTKPTLHLDTDLLKKHLQEVRDTKQKHLVSTLQAIGEPELAAEALMNGEATVAIQKALRSNEQFAKMLESLHVVPPTKISATTGKRAWAFAKTDDGFRELQEHPDPRVQAVVAARLGVKTTLEETRTERFIEMGKRGLFPVPLKYYGARTGRWSGMDSVNMQNLPSRGVVTLKQAIQAPEGHVIVGADLSNIELRVGLWLAGQMDKLQQLGEGKDLYKDFAAKVFDVAYDDVTKEQRFIGKTSQLSLIYGVGAAKLRQAIKVGSGTDIGEVEAKRIVDLYRTQYAHVKATWDDGEHCLQQIMHGQSRSYGHKGLIKVEGKRGCLLPSGLYMQYPDLKQILEEGKKKWVYQTRKGREYIYGAKFFQGLVQSLARCVMGEQMVRINKRYHTLLTVHDADYVLVKDHEAQNAVDFVLAQMRRAPTWMPDIPLDAEAGYGKTLADC